MPRTASATPLLLSLALAIVPLAGCNKLNARIELKKGNELYAQEKYLEAIDQFKKGLDLDPEAKFAWRSVGLSAMALFRPDTETPENLKLGGVAIDAFKKYLEAFPNDTHVQEYLLTSYMGTKRFDEALGYLKQKQAANPNDPAVDQGIVSILTQQNKLEDAFNWAKSHVSRTNKEVFHGIGAVCWDKAFRDVSLDPVARGKVVDLGLKAEEEALRLDPKYFEAMTYYNLLFREKAKLEPDPFKAQELYAKAEELLKKALALREAAQKEAEKQAAAAGN
jgi:tetratricopeptide (TPR) repeat protein